MTSTNNNLHNNNVSTLAAGTSSSAFSKFCVYRYTLVRLSDLSIRTLVSDPISAKSYRKALIVKLCFHQMLSLSESSSVSFNYLMATVASYFDINTVSKEIIAETTAQSMYRSFFPVWNLIGVTFYDSPG